MSQQFIFIDKNKPGVFYYGTICHMEGCRLNGGIPERCYVGNFESRDPKSSVKFWKDYYADKRPGDKIEESLVVKAPVIWHDACVIDAIKQTDAADNFDSSMTVYDVSLLEVNDCIFDQLTIEDVEYPIVKWVITNIHPRDNDLLFITPFFECDPYGNITDIDFDSQMQEKMGIENKEDIIGKLIEDKNGQDHVFLFHGHGIWAHRSDLVGKDRSYSREIV